MLNKIKLALILYFMALISAQSVCFAETMTIKKIVKDNAENILLINANNLENIKNATLITLKEPYRVVIDIPDAVLADVKQSIDFEKNGISNVKIAQFSAEPNIVRIVFTANNEKTLNKINYNRTDCALLFSLNTLKTQKIFDTPIFTDKLLEETNNTETIDKNKNNLAEENQKEIAEKIETPIKKLENYIEYKNIVQNDNALIISGAGKVTIKEPILLKEPNRVVIDLPFAKLSENLLKEYTLKNNDTVRVAQFDPNTVRVVVNTDKLHEYTTVLSADLQSVMVTMSSKIDTKDFINSKANGEIKEINVEKKDDLTTILTLNSDTPMINKIEKNNDFNRIELELFNINSPDEDVIDKLELTEQFYGIDLFDEDKKQNPKLAIPLNNTTGVEIKSNINGNKLQITLKDLSQIVTTKNEKMKGLIVIDPGHGGYDPGAMKDGIQEKDITLDISKRVCKYLKKEGINVVMTRHSDDTISLKNRTKIANKNNPDAFISIHVNSSYKKTIKGLETHWYKKKSKHLANKIQEKMVSNIVVPDRGIKKSRFYVLNHTRVPSALIEVGFMSNPTERYQLLTEERKETTAKAIAEGILQYLKEKYSPETTQENNNVQNQI